MVAPVENGGCGADALVTPRAAYSHSASVGSRQVLPVLRVSQAANAVASSQDTLMTGRRPRPQPSSPALCAQPPSATQASHWANVTSCLPMANEAMATLRCGP